MNVYFDNAATTALAPEALEAMLPWMKDHYGNPSSTHHYGRKVKSAVEMARKNMARLLNCSPMEICFTSGGTEADNTALRGSVMQLGVKHVISSAIEHHAVLHTLESLHEQGLIQLSMVELDSKGQINLGHLEALLAKANEKTLVSLMHANNEIGTMIDLQAVAALCKEYDALFHSDTVQTMGHYPFDLAKADVDFLVGSAHKFHGPKGIGFLYINRRAHLEPLIYGGSQERNMRAGTENVYGIVGMAKALELALEQQQMHQEHISALKEHMKAELLKAFPGLVVNGCEAQSLYTVLNVTFPPSPQGDMLLFLLDIDGIAVSGGSACSSGSNQGSHVLRGITGNAAREGTSIRFSFGRYNTMEEVDYTIEKLKQHFTSSVSKTMA